MFVPLIEDKDTNQISPVHQGVFPTPQESVTECLLHNSFSIYIF